jgi:DNA repair protein RadA/Sms
MVKGTIAVGEVGLTGEIRATSGVQRRLSEAARLGFKKAIVPSTGSDDLRAVEGLTIYPVSDLTTAVRVGLEKPSS